MPRYKLVIDDVDKAHAARIRLDAKSIKVMEPHLPEHVVQLRAAARNPVKPEPGEIWTVADTDCPDGQPNCRYCGDPAFEATCRQVGHCPLCGVGGDGKGGGGHGVAPNSVLAAHGLRLEAV